MMAPVAANARFPSSVGSRRARSERSSSW
jgi:hypothetical protein